jgi:hypothetical protein
LQIGLLKWSGIIFAATTSLTTSYTTKDIRALAANRALGPYNPVKTRELDAGGGRILLIKNVGFILSLPRKQ